MFDPDKTFDSDTIIKFIYDVVEFRKMQWGPGDKKYVFIAENARDHTNKKMSDYLIKHGVSLITFVTYSPSPNQWEKMIGWLKAKIHSWIASGR